MRLFLILMVVLLIGCSPKVRMNEVTALNKYPALTAVESFAFVPIDSISRIDTSRYIGEISIKDGGLTIDCDLETIKNLAREKASAIGGNCIVIKKHSSPDRISTCHRISGSIYRIDNADDYEEEIIWNSKRKIKLPDFKGSAVNRPFESATYTSIRYWIIQKPLTKKYIIKSKTLFDCRLSYIKGNQDTIATLAYHQVLFDIAELYRRLFLIKLESKGLKFRHLINQHEEIYRELYDQFVLKQDEYVSEVAANGELQAKWQEWIALELEKTKVYAPSEMTIKAK